MKLYIRILASINRRSIEDGATAVEYGLIISLIALFIAGAVGAIGTGLLGIFNEAAAAL